MRFIVETQTALTRSENRNNHSLRARDWNQTDAIASYQIQRSI
jgi:hypothetical protein